jgi:hypothetical protein
MTTTIISPMGAICEAIAALPGIKVLNYGEAVEAVAPSDAGNYVTENGQTFCSVNDNADLVCFFIRQSARPNTQVGGGRSHIINRDVQFRLVVNSKLAGMEAVMAVALNKVSMVSLGNSNYGNREIARTYFGINERLPQTQFFTIDFTLTERIDCKIC